MLEKYSLFSSPSLVSSMMGGPSSIRILFPKFSSSNKPEMSSRSHNPLCLLAKDMKARVACQLSPLVCTFGKKRTSRVKAPAFSVERTITVGRYGASLPRACHFAFTRGTCCCLSLISAPLVHAKDTNSRPS